MSLLSRSTIPPQLEEQFERLHEEKEDLLKERKKQFRELAKGIKEMCDTDGWKKALYPLLKKLGDPAQLFGKKPDVYAELEPKVAAYARLLKLIERLMTLAEEDDSV